VPKNCPEHEKCVDHVLEILDEDVDKTGLKKNLMEHSGYEPVVSWSDGDELEKKRQNHNSQRPSGEGNGHDNGHGNHQKETESRSSKGWQYE
jgi:hypothetical protein